jgi:uracil-DNA glycosylase
MSTGDLNPVDEPQEDPAEELRQLSGALSSHLSRAKRRGQRWLPTEERLGAARPEPEAAADPAAAPQPPVPPVELREESAPIAEEGLSAPAAGHSTQVSAPRDRIDAKGPAAPLAASPTTQEQPETTVSEPNSHDTLIPHVQPEGADERIRRLATAAGDLDSLRAEVASCEACDLCKTRKQTVFSDGGPRARVMFVGEAPGFHEDQRGVPFVGDAGQMLTDIITKGMKLSREDVYIANVLKCRPPENRDPAPLEKALCTPWLERQIELVDPEVLIPLGRHAASHLLGREDSMGRMRSQVHYVGGRKIVPTYHPAYLLRTPSAKKDCWADIKLAMGELGLLGD